MAASVFALIQVQFNYAKDMKLEQIYIPPSKRIVHFTFGYEDFLSSLMWVRMVQDFHVCDQNAQRTIYPEFTKDMDPVEDVLTRELPKSTCDEGWVYQMLDVITDLQGSFETAYLDGGTMLSVMVDDRMGAKKIFDKGRLYYPENWKLLYRSAYHELFEMQNPELAKDLLQRAGARGAPQWVYSLAAKLEVRLGRAAFAKSVLESILKRNPDGPFVERLKIQLQNINEILQKETGVPPE